MTGSPPWSGPRQSGYDDDSGGPLAGPDDAPGEPPGGVPFPDLDGGWEGSGAGPETPKPAEPAEREQAGEPEDVLADEPEETPDPGHVLARLASLLGPSPSTIDVEDLSVHGQNAIGTGATAIGTLNLMAARSDGSGRTWATTLTGTRVRQLADGYAPAPSDPQLDGHLKQRHLVCLSGPAGTGRHAAACLSSSRRHGFDRVALLQAERPTDLLLPDAPWRDGHGYVWRLTEAAVRDLDGTALVGLAARAEAKGATLVLVGDFDRGDQELAGHLVEHRPAAPVDVFRAQLRRQLRGRCVGWCAPGCLGDCVDAYVEDECVANPLLAAHLAGVPRPGEVVRVAELLARTAPRGADLTERLERLLPHQLRDRATRVLAAADGGDTPTWGVDRRRAFRLACAVLAGQPVAEIHAAAGALAAPGLGGAGLGPAFAGNGGPDLSPAADALPGHLYPGMPPEPSSAGGVGTALDMLLGPVLREAVLVVDDDRVLGRQRIEFAPGNDPLRRSLLEVAWADWWLPERLLGWLAHLVREGSPGVRQAAAGAVGWSAVHGVRVALHTVDQLARERRAGVRQAAAIALVGMAMQPELRQHVRGELDRWAAGGAAHLRDTVARAYALGLARLWPETALVQLRRVAEARMQRRNNSVVRGLVEVYVAGHAATVLPALAQWAVAEDEPEVRLHAGRALRVLADRWAPAPRERWPELLDLARAGTVRMADLATCWATALSLPGTAYRAWRTLGFWLNRAEGHPEMADLCLRLIDLVVAGREPLRHRLDHQLRHVWGPLMRDHTTLLSDVRRLIEEDPS
ncbi:hypothetical protein [Micromonospora carbonacea]|uniref:Uncharacterized protein n=1 Tax=Micromonospora carbonacea TaxID=47853 RepID=A0A1C5ASK4_9ACTN|nr:hypothetical protein [Micromonospora carbonacea]SCF48182.1 hypothetical protein GA0070563_11839 [Micromonospora carbonacea]